VTRRTTEWTDLGEISYEAALEHQLATRAGVIGGTGPERLHLLTHSHVYTLGRNADEGDVLADLSWLRDRGVEVVETDRGGQVTYHGPGQLVGYPVLDLSPDRRDVRRYVHDLLEVLVRTLHDFGVDGAAARHEADFLGVWVGRDKIASVGVHVKKWVTTHGFSLNVAPDLSYFAGIVPCGLHGIAMTSMALQLGAERTPAIRQVMERVVGHFGDVYDRRMVEAALPVPAEAAG
jgi:lipoyl(octanoyl) transferase